VEELQERITYVLTSIPENMMLSPTLNLPNKLKKYAYTGVSVANLKCCAQNLM
jgi:hypothetical protein